MYHVTIATDGACSGNPGPGGWAAVLQCEGREMMISGNAQKTTNNRMELRAVVRGLKALRFPCEVEVLTDSAYIVDQINGGYLDKWAANNWIKADKKPVQNVDLWIALRNQLDIHQVTFTKVKGHAGHPLNERCDEEACSQRDLAKLQLIEVTPVK